ncbi:hypothetical protein BHE74_00026434 [Ensete ventricosum]|nr:hypothetical protein GW17_00009031 [Ensete ventricosum]RWW66211.1 hypothetical protein BHE74_00026434 [Ensete ventricosum]
MASSSSDLGHAPPEDDEPASLDELYNINVIPSELFFKFRKQIEGFRVGANLELLLVASSMPHDHDQLNSGFAMETSPSQPLLGTPLTLPALPATRLDQPPQGVRHTQSP